MEPKVFSSERFGEVLATIDEGIVYIDGDDLGRALEFEKPRKAVIDAIKSPQEFYLSDDRTCLMVGPAVVKRLVDFSRVGKEFAAWFKDELEFALKLLEKIEAGPTAEERAAVLEVEGLIRCQQAVELMPDQTFYAKVLDNPAPITTEELAECFGMNTESLLQKLQKLGILEDYIEFGILKYPYVTYGLTRTRLSYDGSDDDSGEVDMRWTQAGQLFVYDLLKKEGILPVMERETDG